MEEPDLLDEREELLQLLERSSGRPLRTRAEVRAYLEELAERRAKADTRAARWQTAKVLTLSVLGAFALLQYYLLDVMLQVMSLPQLTVFVRTSKFL
jgi:hypothetical protein